MGNIMIRFWDKLLVSVLILAGTLQAGQFVWDAPVQVYSAGENPVIAMKGADPVIAFSQSTGFWQIGYTEDIGGSVSLLGPAWDNFTPGLAVDAQGNAHVVWSRYSGGWKNLYQGQVSGSFDGTSYEDIGGSYGTNRNSPQITTSNGIVHVSFRDQWRDFGYYTQKSGGSWTAIETFNAAGSPVPGKMLSQRLLADSADNVYSFALSRSYDYYLSGRADGPYYDKRDSSSSVWSAVLAGDISSHDGTANIGYANDSALEAVWNGGAAAAATLDTVINDDSDHTTGRVLLYRDLLSTAYPLVPIEIFNDGDYDGGIEATADSVTMAIDSLGNYYIVFAAADTAAGQTDTELYVSAVDSQGAVMGLPMQVTDNEIDDTKPRAVMTGNKLHVVWQAGSAINYMTLIGDTPTTCTEALALGYSLDSDITGDCYSNLADLSYFASQWLNNSDMTQPGAQPVTEAYGILEGTATVDGDLSDWQNANWIALDELYEAAPDARDLSDAKWAARWSSAENLIYVAVTGVDTDQVFNSFYYGWDQQDAVELYVYADPNRGADYSQDQDIAQQYVGSPKNATSGDEWVYLRGEVVIPAGVLPGFQAVVNGDTISYEFAVKPYFNLDIDTPANSTEVTLTEGHIIGLDVVIDTKHSDGFGMLCENLNTGKSWFADRFAQFELVTSLGCGDWGYFPADIDQDCVVDLEDFARFAADWMQCFDPENGNCSQPW